MNKVYIKYNPYIVKTNFVLNGENISNLSSFYGKQENVRLQEWIEPSGKWKGLFAELHEYFNSSEQLEVEFKGTLLDFQDLQYASEKYGTCFESIILKHIPSNNQENKLKILKEQFEKIQEGPVEELKDPQIQEAFEKALSSEFEVVVVAPMSSGKSTLINSILGTNLLPEANQATTATITRIKDEDESDTFYVNCKDKEGKVIASDEIANLERITELNRMANEKKNIDLINIRGNIKTIPSDKVNIVFVDTPGGNNPQDETHEEIMKRAIRDENKGMILFVFNLTQLDAGDCDSILEIAAEAMRNARTGKQSRDRFIFVCNKMEEQDPEKESMEQVIKNIEKKLKPKGIDEPNLFLTDARVCKLVRMAQTNMKMTDSEEDKLEGLLKPFNRPSRRLFTDAPISEEKKKEFMGELDSIAKTGEKRSMRAAEINSGIPALEYAIRQYIEKYAQAIKIKTVHDVFMKRVEELDMKSKCEEKWSSSEIAYLKMRQELERKKEILEKDKKLKEFKEEVDSIKTDFSEVISLQEQIVSEIMDLPYKFPEKIERDEANELLAKCHKQLIGFGDQSQIKLESALESCVYDQCRRIIQKYEAYLQELDRQGLLNIGDYSFKKIGGFDTLTIEDLENVTDDFVKEEVVNTVRRKRSGFFNAVKRLFHSGDGWYWEDTTEEFVSLRSFIKNKISKLEDEVLKEIDEEIKRAKNNENKVKQFAKDHLSGIKNQVEDQMRKVEMATSDLEKLKENADKNKENKEWLDGFVKEMSEMIDV